MVEDFRRPAVMLALLAMPVVACGDRDPAGLDPALAVTCGAEGRLHGGTIGDETWAAADNPHVIVKTLDLGGVLTIEPGVRICVEPEVQILIGEDGAAIHASGTAETPIVFTAGDPARPWGGIVAPETCYAPGFDNGECTAGLSTIEHVRIEHALYGVRAGEAAHIDRAHFRQIRCTAVEASHLRRSRVDSAGLDGFGCAAVYMGHAASRGRTEVFEDNVILGSGGDGLVFRGYRLRSSSSIGRRVALLGGRIENSAGSGLVFGFHYRSDVISEVRPLRITGGGGVPVSGPLAAVMRIWPTAADQDSLRGNAADTVAVWGHTGQGVVVGSGIVLKNKGHILLPFPTVASPEGVRIEPGGEMMGELWINGPLRAEGTADAPVRITGSRLGLLCEELDEASCDAGSRIVDAQLEDVKLMAGSQLVVLERVVAHTSELAVGIGSVVTDLVSEGAPNDALRLRSGVRVSGCGVRGSGSAGIIVASGSVDVRIHDCALESNGGPGVRNQGADIVDARFNWWGDPAGPLGPGGDGVEGDVDFSEHRTSPPP